MEVSRFQIKKRVLMPPSGHARIVERLLADLRHPPENELLYKPVREDDPDIIELAGEHPPNRHQGAAHHHAG